MDTVGRGHTVCCRIVLIEGPRRRVRQADAHNTEGHAYVPAKVATVQIDQATARATESTICWFVRLEKMSQGQSQLEDIMPMLYQVEDILLGQRNKHCSQQMKVCSSTSLYYTCWKPDLSHASISRQAEGCCNAGPLHVLEVCYLRPLDLPAWKIISNWPSDFVYKAGYKFYEQNARIVRVGLSSKFCSACSHVMSGVAYVQSHDEEGARELDSWISGSRIPVAEKVAARYAPHLTHPAAVPRLWHRTVPTPMGARRRFR